MSKCDIQAKFECQNLNFECQNIFGFGFECQNIKCQISILGLRSNVNIGLGNSGQIQM